jgi:hypothetical protein
LHRGKYVSLGHKHFAGGIRIAEREGLTFRRFLRELISFEHKNFAGVIRIAEREGLPFRRF